MRNIAENIWIFDGKAVPFLTLPFTTRMTVIRLSTGELWVHSPIELNATIQVQIEQLGVVKYLIAPNHLHHLFLADWQLAYPDAICYGTDEVIKKRTDIQFEHSLNLKQDWPWALDIEQVLFTGSPLMEECIFFHERSGVLIVTDLVENFPDTGFNSWQRIVAKGVGILAPNGKMPLDWRLSFAFNKTEARSHLSVILGWQPEIVVMSHGLIIEQDAVDFLKRSFGWLQ
ncbi:DUF4336 domain-containing protein [Photobacterium rosenbergii]|uniref:DUF4336 domain-containing protein n=1 Tax=Photobacterium rosenbergii TaxID=294936 RepID=UPI001C99DE53|nr:DUF4336 domain-containing protein [Photobacterium rosenbergii]MBY5947744.1 DUF4336 domain-containing protein [Photobacterium rosenbergii]